MVSAARQDKGPLLAYFLFAFAAGNFLSRALAFSTADSYDNLASKMRFRGTSTYVKPFIQTPGWLASRLYVALMCWRRMRDRISNLPHVGLKEDRGQYPQIFSH